MYEDDEVSLKARSNQLKNANMCVPMRKQVGALRFSLDELNSLEGNETEEEVAQYLYVGCLSVAGIYEHQGRKRLQISCQLVKEGIKKPKDSEFLLKVVEMEL